MEVMILHIVYFLCIILMFSDVMISPFWELIPWLLVTKLMILHSTIEVESMFKNYVNKSVEIK